MRFIRAIRRALRESLDPNPFVSLVVSEPRVRHGTDRGGWVICPDGLARDSVVYSCGVGDDISFDLSLIAQFGVTIHAFDPTPAAIAWVRSLALPEAFQMHDWGISAHDGRGDFYAPSSANFISHSLMQPEGNAVHAFSAPVKKLTTTMRELGHRRIDLLKMDIEGAEYAVLKDVLSSGIQVGQLLVEFHDRFPSIGWQQTDQSVRELLKHRFRLFNIEEDNYSFLKSSSPEIVQRSAE